MLPNKFEKQAQDDCEIDNDIKVALKERITLQSGEIENFRHMTQKSPILILEPRDSLFNGKLCGVFFFS